MPLRASSTFLLLSCCLLACGCARASQAQSDAREESQVKVARADAGLPAETRPGAAALAADVDSDSDGFPDSAEIRSFDDRLSFRRWFTAIAEMQFYRASDEWNTQQRDCAGLVRFGIREALRRHNRLWFKRLGAEYEAVAPDVRALSLDSEPLKDKLFRTDYGAFKRDDPAAGRFSEFADARTLKNYNCVFLTRDRREALPGDLLFFHEPRNPRYPYHVMIFLGEARYASEGAADWVVYHTGSSPKDNGTVKKVRLAVLDKHPDRRWRPVVSNQNFLGFYRLKIVN